MMNRVSVVLVAVVCFIFCGQIDASVSGFDQLSQPSLEGSTASQVLYLHDQEKLALDLNWEFQEMWDEPIFLSLGALERRHMDELFVLMEIYGLEPLVTTRTEGEYGDGDHMEAYAQLHSRGNVSLLEAYLAAAYVEEWDITKIRAIIDSTDEQLLIDTLTRLLADAKNHLRMLVSRIYGLSYDYKAQMLSQLEVDEICSGVKPYTGTHFTLNSGLNDAWYYPFTSGQGFFITVYPDSQTVFVSWMSYDTMFPGADSVSHVGDAGQRWLVAHGPYVGNRAELEVFSASGGLFDRVESAPELESIGYMILQFDDCSNGSIKYILMPLFGGYMIPIQRVAPDSVVQCEINIQP